jgi:hypothetical protein
MAGSGTRLYTETKNQLGTPSASTGRTKRDGTSHSRGGSIVNLDGPQTVGEPPPVYVAERRWESAPTPMPRPSGSARAVY